VRDIERDGYHRRIRRTLAEEMPILEDIPGEPLAVERRYFQANAEEVFADFRAARADTITLLSGLGPIELQRLALFEGRPVALHNLLHFLCSHDNQHIAGLHWLLGKMNGPPPSADVR
jgi:DinB superfamily